jgi:hypothetical protein
MNERINELAREAGIKFVPMVCEGVEYDYLHVDMDGSEDLEKFAELIVQECMTMCDTVSADYLKHRKGAFDFQDKNIYAEGEAACDILKFKMKTHFGVEE